VSPSTRTILLTMHNAYDHILKALEAGVRGCVLKTYNAHDLIQAIHEVMNGGIYLSPGVTAAVVEAYRAKSSLPADPLTHRERQVLQLIAEGKRTREAAALLGISVKTAESHRTRIMKKLGLRETAALVRYAIHRGLSQL
jgi:DNA-binding NarL/FixJ family response regulator